MPITRAGSALSCLLATALALPAGIAGAADENGKFALKGAGFLPCQVYVQERERRSSVYYMVAGWIEGFISAHNRYTPETYDVTSFESGELLLGVVQNHCESHPNDQLYQVLGSMISQLHPDRVVKESPKVAIAEGERSAELYRDTIEKMQRQLTTLGLYKGPVDGRFTDATRAALQAFQSDIGFEMTGFPDQTTLWRLLRK